MAFIIVFLVIQINSLTTVLHQNIHDNKDGTLKEEDIQELSYELLPLKEIAKEGLSPTGTFPFIFNVFNLDSCDDI